MPKVVVGADEAYPVFYLEEFRPKHHHQRRRREISQADYNEYTRVVQEYDIWQRKLACLFEAE